MHSCSYFFLSKRSLHANTSKNNSPFKISFTETHFYAVVSYLIGKLFSKLLKNSIKNSTIWQLDQAILS